MKKQKLKWNPAPDASPFDALEEHSPFDALEEHSPFDALEEAQMADDIEPYTSPIEQFISWSVAEDTPAKGENPVASIETPAPTAKELARLNRFPPA